MGSSQPLPKKECKKCGHKWVPRVDNPQRCPKCLKFDWDNDIAKK